MTAAIKHKKITIVEMRWESHGSCGFKRRKTEGIESVEA